MQLIKPALLASLGVGIGGALASAGPDMLLNEMRAVGAAGLLMSRQNTNLQTFTGALGGIKADAVTKTSDAQRPFEVAGDTFTDIESAAGRSCDNQKNSCAEAANKGSQTFTVSDCDTQNNQCHSNINSVNVSSAAGQSSASTTSSSSSSSSSSLSTSSTFTTTSSTSTTSSTLSTTTTSAQLALVSSNSQFNFFCEV